jgi:hypothetical protein
MRGTSACSPGATRRMWSRHTSCSQLIFVRPRSPVVLRQSHLLRQSDNERPVQIALGRGPLLAFVQPHRPCCPRTQEIDHSCTVMPVVGHTDPSDCRPSERAMCISIAATLVSGCASAIGKRLRHNSQDRANRPTGERAGDCVVCCVIEFRDVVSRYGPTPRPDTPGRRAASRIGETGKRSRAQHVRSRT